MILGIDVSTYLEELEHGAVYLDGDVRIDPLDAFNKTRQRPLKSILHKLFTLSRHKLLL